MIGAMTGGELAIVIAGRREDWPGGARTLTPRDPQPGRRTGRTLWFGAELDPDGSQVWFRITMDGHSAGCGRRHLAARGDRLIDALLDWMTTDRQLGTRASTASRSGSRRTATRGSSRCPGDDGFPRPDPFRRGRARAPDADRPPPRRGLAQPEHPPGVLRGGSAASTPGSTAGGSMMRASPPTSPSSTTRGEPRQAPRRRWPRRASGPASPMSRARPGNAPPWVLAGYRRTAGGRGRGQTRGSGRRTSPPSSPPATALGRAAAASSPTPSPASAAASTP